MEAVNGDGDVGSKRFPGYCGVGGPHVHGHLLDMGQQALLPGTLQVRQYRGFFPVFQHFQDTLVVMIDNHGDVLLVLFF
jgi:hypothetical protein